MYTYKEQLQMLEGIRVKPGQTLRIDCPFCRGQKTFSITSKDGSRVWNCYKASCAVSGAKTIGRTTGQVRERLAGKMAPTKCRTEVPEILSDPRHHDRVMHYLRLHGSLEAYENDWLKIRYAPAEDRVLFFFPTRLADGAVGRSLNGIKPKWKAYGDTGPILTVGEGDTLVVVEDAASACSVARVSGLVGGALLGTHLSDTQRHQLRGFKSVIIALDRDASTKALSIQRRTQGLTDVKVRFLREDLKYLTPAEIGNLLR